MQKHLYTLFFLACTSILIAQPHRSAQDSARVLLAEIAQKLLLPPDAGVQAIRAELYKNVVTTYDGSDCAVATLPEPFKTWRNGVNQAIRLQKQGYQALQSSNRSTGPARIKWFFNTTATSNRGGQSGCNSAVNTAMGNLNTRFGNAGFAAGQFTLPATDPVMINQDWDAAAGSNDAGVLLYTFGDWLFENSPAGPGEQHLSIGITHLANMNGSSGIAADPGACGETAFNSEDDVYRGFVLLCNPSMTSSNLVTHEVGHCFSLPHNNTPPVCPLGSGGNIPGYVMSASSGTPWHPVSLSDLYTATTWNNAQGNEYPLFNFTPLPLELIRFEVFAEASRHYIEWEVSQNTDSGLMEVQKSTDGIRFETLAAFHFEANRFRYEYLDASPAPGNNWYRLCLRPDTGSPCHFSPVRVIHQTSNSKQPFIAPNPANGNTITLFLPEASDDEALQIQVYDIQGRLRSSGQYAPQAALDIPATALPDGVYLLQIRQEARYWQCRVIRKQAP